MSVACQLDNSKKPSSGHRVSHSNIKTKRRFLPNIQPVSLKSDVLGKIFRLKIATRTLRTVLKHGGLDSYLLNIGAKNLTDYAMKIRRAVQKKSKSAAQ